MSYAGQGYAGRRISGDNGTGTASVAVLVFMSFMVLLAFSLIFFEKPIDEYLNFVLVFIPIVLGQLYLSKQGSEIKTQNTEIQQTLTSGVTYDEARMVNVEQGLEGVNNRLTGIENSIQSLVEKVGR